MKYIALFTIGLFVLYMSYSIAGVSGCGCSFAVESSSANLTSAQAIPLNNGDLTIDITKPKMLMSLPKGVTIESSRAGKHEICIHGMPHNIIHKYTQFIDGKTYYVFDLKIDTHNKDINCEKTILTKNMHKKILITHIAIFKKSRNYKIL